MCDLERECYGQNTCQLGRELLEWNDIILKHMVTLKEQKEELDFIIKKQEDELNRLKDELDEKSYVAKNFENDTKEMLDSIDVYDKVIKMLEDGYGNLVDTSEGVAQLVSQEVNELEQIMDKKTNTDEGKTKLPCECADSDAKKLKKRERQGCCVKPECPGRGSKVPNKPDNSPPTVK